MFIVVVIDSGIDVRMQRAEFGANCLADRDFVRFLFDRSMETLAEAIGLRTVCFCPRTLDVIDGQEQLIVAPPRGGRRTQCHGLSGYGSGRHRYRRYLISFPIIVAKLVSNVTA